MKAEHKVVVLSIIAAVAIWAIDAAIDYLFFYEGDFWESLVPVDHPVEFYKRGLVFVGVVVLGLLISRGVAKRRQAEEALRESEQAEQGFSKQLAALNEVSNELSRVESFDDLSRRAVELGRSRFGFDRLGIRFIIDSPDTSVGSFGVDENGRLRDERSTLRSIIKKRAIWRVLTGETRSVLLTDTNLLDDNGKVVGRGCRAIAALWDGHQTIGCITADNLLHRKPITERQFELLTLYASSLGHLFSRKRAEEALRESEERLEAFMDSATDAFFLLDSQLNFADVNKTATERFGMSKEEIVGKNILDILPGLREAGRYDKYQEVLETGKPFSTDGLALRQQHGEVYLNIRAFKVGDGLGIISTDITERKQAQEKLEMQRQEQQTILDSVPALIFYKDMENRLIRVNNALLESFGMSKEEVEGKSLFDLFPNQADDYWRDDKEVMASGRSKRNIIESVETAQGTRWYQTDKIPYMDDAGNIVGIIGFSLDVTERKKAEESLEEQARQTRVLLDSMPCVAMLLRPGTREIVASNQAAVQVGAVPGKTCYETFGQREAPCPWCLAPEVWATGKPQGLEIDALGIIWDAHWRPVAPDLYLHFAFDVTERERMDAELMQAEKLAAMGTMIAGVAHELNNPLASVVGIGQLLAEKEKNLSPQGREGVRIILDAANQCRHVVQNLTTFAKKEKPEKKTVDIKEILHAGVDLMRPVLKTDRIEIQEDYPRTPLWARVSPQSIEQVVVNIITNAAEAMRPNGPGGILKIRARVAGGNIRVEMEDNGPGIDEPERIFEPFYSTKEWGKGTGLGLSVSHNIVAAHGGTLTAANTHTGAMFKIMLPRAEAGNSRKA